MPAKFNENDASYNSTSGMNTKNFQSDTMNSSNNFTSNQDSYSSNQDSYVNDSSTTNYGGANNKQSDYSTTTTTNGTSGRHSDSVGCFPGGSIKREIKVAAKHLFGMGHHKKGCQNGSTTTTTSTCSCANQAACPHRTQHSGAAVGSACDCNDSDAYTSSTTYNSDNKASDFSSNHEQVDSYNNSSNYNDSMSNNYNDTKTFLGQANVVGGETSNSGVPVGGNNY